jgi:cephalosporin-C deacetylase
MKKYLIFCLFIFSCFRAFCQPSEKYIKVIVTPNNADWMYRIGEKATFAVSISQSGILLKNAKIHYEVALERMEPMMAKDSVLANGSIQIEGGTLSSAGFLRCTVSTVINGITYKGWGTAGFEPDKIQPTIQNPDDFQEFWEKAKTANAKIPMDARMTLLPDKCTENVNVYHVNLQNFALNSRLYGILSVPKKEGKYPAILIVPGAGIRAYNGDIATAEQGIITFEIGIHGIPVIMPPQYYTDFSATWGRYFTYNVDDKDLYYYKKVYLGCLRANDFLVSLPQFDGANLGVMGVSQGGALSIVTATLDSRVKCLSAFYPALCDVTGYLQNRAGGWPHIFADKTKWAKRSHQDKIETMRYYDVVNFAKRLKVPGFYSWGFNDDVCPPTSFYAAFNTITAPKTLKVVPEIAHWTYPEQNQERLNWMLAFLKKGK